MASDAAPSSVTTAPLAGVLSRQNADLLVGSNIFRRYGGSLVTSARTQGTEDVSHKAIGYSIGCRTQANHLQGMFSNETPQIDQRICLNEAVRVEIAGVLRRYSNFGSDLQTADLAGVVFMLAAACAKFSATGTLSCTEIRVGHPIAVTSITVQDRVTTARGTVYIPRHAALVDVPGLFEALCAAVNGMGGRVVTDVVAVNPVNNAVRLVEPEGAELAHACWTGLRALMHLHDTSGYGAVAALAAVKGMHSVLTVVGHTDEGAIMRSVLRSHRYAVPYGGVYIQGMEGYVGLPTYRKIGGAAQQAAVDSILLMSAAAVAVCDPTIVIDGRSYPTVLTSHAGEIEKSGSANEGSDDDSRAITSLLAHSGGAFSRLYVAELSRLFCVSGGEAEAARALGQMFGAMANTVDRHARHRAIAPFYWVEPTSLYRTRPDTPATKAGYGPICGTDTSFDMPVAEELAGHGAHYYDQAVDMQWRTARTSGWAVHMLGHARGGAANFVFRQADPGMFTFKGAGAAADTAAAMEAGESLESYLWGHASCMVPAPSECLYAGRRVRVMTRVAIAGAGFTSTPTHTFTTHDLMASGGGVVKCTSSRPNAIAPGGMVDDRREVRRARAQAELALECARVASSRGPAASAVYTNVAFVEPSAPAVIAGTEAPRAAVIAPEEAEEVVAPAVIRQGPTEAPVMLRGPVGARLPATAAVPGAVTVLTAAEGEVGAVGVDSAASAMPVAPVAAPEADGSGAH